MNILVHFCDRCSASIPEKDVADKAAFVQGGLSLCTTCRRALGGGTGDPEIFFCESCGRSISVPELAGGAVSVVASRLLCSGCRPAAAPSPAGPPAAAAPPVSRRPGGALLVFSVVALLGAGAAGITLFVPGLRAPLEEKGLLSRTSKEPAARTESARGGAEEAATELRELRSAVERLSDAVGTLAARPPAPDLEARFAALETRLLEAARGDSEVIASLEGSVSDLRVLLDGVREEVDAFKMLASVSLPSAGDEDEGPRGGGRDPSPDPPGPSEVPSAPPAAGNPDLARWIADLESADSGKRFTAIVELTRLRDPGAVSAIGRTLATDPDVYCRTESCRALGELRDYRGVPHLIAALRDRESMVALASAEALKQITKKSFGFTSKATPQERREATSRWESWWEKNKDSLLPPNGSKD